MTYSAAEESGRRVETETGEAGDRRKRSNPKTQIPINYQRAKNQKALRTLSSVASVI
jgi:hypothetical protein